MNPPATLRVVMVYTGATNELLADEKLARQLVNTYLCIGRVGAVVRCIEVHALCGVLLERWTFSDFVMVRDE